MAAVPVNYAWIPSATVATGQYYRFAVLAPATWTEDATQTYLEGLGWDVKSIGAPPADVQAALNAAHVVFPGGNVPQAFYILGTWTGSPGALPADPQIVYEQLAAYTVVPAGTPNDSTNPDPIPSTASSDLAITFLGLGAIAFLGWLVYKESKGINTERFGYSHNPIQVITVNVNGRKVPFRIEDTGSEWKALADVKIGRRKSLIVATGPTKSEALQMAIAKTSSVFATADV